MEKSPVERLEEGLGRLGLEVPAGVPERLWDYAQELLRWNARVNLTAITRLDEVVEKHLLDSLAVLPEVRSATSLLDLGAGAGLPGIPLALALPGLSIVLADAVGKKVAFMKTALVKAGLVGRGRAVHVRAAGHPDDEGLGRAQVVISRALMDVEPWLALARAYLGAGGRVVAMLGQAPDEAALKTAAAKAGLTLLSRRTWTLPFSGDPRGAAVFGP